MDKGHENLILDLKMLLQLAESYEYHDFKNTMFAAPKSALINTLFGLAEKAKQGEYDN